MPWNDRFTLGAMWKLHPGGVSSAGDSAAIGRRIGTLLGEISVVLLSLSLSAFGISVDLWITVSAETKFSSVMAYCVWHPCFTVLKLAFHAKIRHHYGEQSWKRKGFTTSWVSEEDCRFRLPHYGGHLSFSFVSPVYSRPASFLRVDVNLKRLNRPWMYNYDLANLQHPLYQILGEYSDSNSTPYHAKLMSTVLCAHAQSAPIHIQAPQPRPHVHPDEAGISGNFLINYAPLFTLRQVFCQKKVELSI